MADARAEMRAGARGSSSRPFPSTHVPTWLPITSLTLAVLGLGASIYLTYEHFTQNASLACAANSVINCAAVTTSAQSKVFGIPVAVLGLAFFVAIIPMCLPAVWRINTRAVRWARIGAVTVGIGFVFYLIYAELFDIGKICEWCTGVHILTVALFGVVLFGTASLDPIDDK
jgi:uncharacterized membrane protein